VRPGHFLQWFCLSSAGAFAAWTLGSSPADLRQLEIGLPRYLVYLLAGGVIGGVLGTVLRRRASAARFTGPLLCASCLLYAGFLKTLGWPSVPWWLLAAVSVLTLARPARLQLPPHWGSLALLHSMGTMTGLYLSFHLTEFTAAWGAFRQVAGALWRLTTTVLPL
jgi:hypothetical protein